jgi:Golgi nucleoside diphosphatase
MESSMWKILLIAAALTVLSSNAIDCSDTDPYSYGIIIDGGSTGCRLYFYRWDARVLSINDDTLPIDEIPVTYPLQEAPSSSPSKFQTQVGIGQFGSDAQGAADSVWPMVQAAQTEFANCPQKMKKTPIYLFATAGMRVIPTAQSAAILKVSRIYILSLFVSN